MTVSGRTLFRRPQPPRPPDARTSWRIRCRLLALGEPAALLFLFWSVDVWVNGGGERVGARDNPVAAADLPTRAEGAPAQSLDDASPSARAREDRGSSAQGMLRRVWVNALVNLSHRACYSEFKGKTCYTRLTSCHVSVGAHRFAFNPRWYTEPSSKRPASPSAGRIRSASE